MPAYYEFFKEDKGKHLNDMDEFPREDDETYRENYHLNYIKIGIIMVEFNYFLQIGQQGGQPQHTI